MPFRESVRNSLSTHRVAAVAQSVERYLGKVEVGGSIPLGSLFKEVRIYGLFFVYAIKENHLGIGDSLKMTNI